MTKREIISDEILIKKILKGDSDSFRFLIERYQNRVYSIGWRLFRNSDDAHDFSQEVFLKVYNNLESYKGSSSFGYWLARVAYNFGISQLEKLKRQSNLSAGELCVNDASDDFTPEEGQMKREIRMLVEKAIDDLPETYRVCVDLYFYMNLKYSEIEDITGIPVNTIKSNVYRAKTILRDRLRGTIAEEYYEMR